jgi:hypothetical protein
VRKMPFDSWIIWATFDSLRFHCVGTAIVIAFLNIWHGLTRTAVQT